MTFALFGAAAVLVAAAVAYVFLLRKLTAHQENVPPDLDWCRNFSVARYRPLERLFNTDDFEFLASQPGYRAGMCRKLRADRRRICRRYLRALNRDFNRLAGAAQVLLLLADQDRPELARALLKQRAIFVWAFALIECRLTLQVIGIGTINVRPLVTALESMREQVRMLSPQPQASAA